MKSSNIHSQLKFVNRIGATLSTEERIAIEAQSLKLTHEYQYEQWNFWGRIQGIAKNYYIIEGVNFKGAQNFPSHKYFWANDDFKFAELPSPRLEFISNVETMNDCFTGQHEKIILKSHVNAPKVMKGPNGEEMYIKQKNFTELDRLSLLITMISYDCGVVPLGAYRMIPTHEIIFNPDFRGLKMCEIKNAQNYVHFRPPLNQDKRILIECDKALERNDFMDSIDSDKIKGSWSVQADESGSEVTIRSMVWPGYVGYHRANSCTFGGVYMGSGIKCHDLPFLL